MNQWVLSLAVLLVGLVGCQKPDNSIVGKWDKTTLAILDENGFKYRDLNKDSVLNRYEDRRLSVDMRVEDLLERMTLLEKTGLMGHPFYAFPKNPKSDTLTRKFIAKHTRRKRSLIQRKCVTHFAVMGSGEPNIQAIWQNEVQKQAEQGRLGVPVTISSDPRHGFREQSGVASEVGIGISQWCEPVGFGAIGDKTIVEEFGRIASVELRAIGIRTALHPMADLATEPRWTRIIGTFGEDADLSAKLTAAYIRGFQGEKFGTESVSCMTKHFSGGGPQEDGWDAHLDYGRNQCYPGNNFEYHIKPFIAAIEAGGNQMMPYYGIPLGQTSEDVAFGYNKEVLTEILRERLGFDGVICSDWNIIQYRPWGVDSLSVDERLIKSIEAGIDQFGGENWGAELAKLVEEGKISEERINASARRILKIKFEAGLFDNPFVDDENANEICATPDFIEKGLYSQKASQVLLKNEGNILPLNETTKVFVVGYDKEVAAKYGAVVNNIEDADVVVMKLKAPYDKTMTKGLEKIFHQGPLAYTEAERDSFMTILKQKPSVITMYMDRPAVEPELTAEVEGYIANFGACDEALFDVIYGKFTPQGKLPFEIPSSLEAVEEQKEDVPYDSKNPLFKFGFGLTY
ncbi:glycoside hydrolase family 3 protein [Labilibacter sediminis]|nr:glycoside hydrolase family 3 protein [Labilibacter sediminis]